MVRETFEEWLKNIFAYFEKAPPKARTLDLWYEELKDIDYLALDYIYKHLIQAELKGNVPMIVKSLYREWKKTVGKRDGPCGCHETWWDVCFFYPEKQLWAIYSLRCGNCGAAGPKCVDDLVNMENYEQEPTRWEKETPPWGMIYPESKSRRLFIDKILAHQEKLRESRPPKGNLFEPGSRPGEELPIGDLPF